MAKISTRRYVALDPGGTTGICVYAPTFEDVEVGQFILPDHHAELWSYLRTVQPDVVICETYGRGAWNNIDLKAVEYIGIARLYCLWNGSTFAEQNLSAKALWSDDKIRRIGLWRPNSRHAMDALKHFLYYKTSVEKDMTYVNLLR